MKLSTGQTLIRKEGGKLKPWTRETAQLRLTMRPDSYLDRERSVANYSDGRPATP
jgi:hypothetical protein